MSDLRALIDGTATAAAPDVLSGALLPGEDVWVGGVPELSGTIFFSGCNGLAKSMATSTSFGFWTGLPRRVARTVKRPDGFGSRIQRRR